MWLFTKYGFFSVVCAKQKTTTGFDGPMDPGHMMVRARKRAHLVNLQIAATNIPEVRDAPIIAKGGTDYPVRLVIPRYAWDCLAVELAQDVKYDNFKSEVSATSPETDYLDLLHEVWAASRDLHRPRPRPLPGT